MLKKLNTAPTFPANSASPYTNALDDDLVALYGNEIDAAYGKVGPKLERTVRNRRLHDLMSLENRKVLERLEQASDGKEAGAAKKIAQKVFQALSSNEVSKVASNARYDHRGDVGFCFGRAAMVHYLLLENGVRPDRIAKIFVIGPLRYREQLWNFHMATLVKGEKGQWWVIDNLFDRALPHDTWVDRASALDVNPSFPQIRFYVTDPRKFQPAFGKYQLEHFKIPELAQYFTDLFRSLKK